MSGIYRNPDTAFWIYVAASLGWVLFLLVMPL